MKTIKANNFKQAFEELKAIDPVIADKLEETIDENDAGHNIVLCIKRTNNESTKQYETVIAKQPFDNISFEKLQRDYQFLGFDKIILLHKADGAKVIDLNAERADTDGANTTAPVAGKSEEQIREEMRQEYEAKYAGYVPAPTAPVAMSQEEKDAKVKADRKTEFLALNLNSVKKGDDLHALAKEFEVDVTALTKVDDVRGALAEFQKEQKEATK